MTRSAPRITILCRASLKDGIGHLTRSKTVASALGDWGEVQMIVLGDNIARSLLDRSGIAFHLTEKEEDVAKLLSKSGPDIALFDLTNLSAATMKKFAAARLRISLCPVFNQMESVDVLFNRSSVPGESWPKGSRLKVFAGREYAIVGEHCRKISEEQYSRSLQANPLSLAVCMGGIDAANKTLRVLQRIRDIPDPLLVWVLLGEGYAHSYQELVDVMTGGGHEIILAKTNSSMWRILETCSLAILGGGTTTYEAAHAGLPSVNTLVTPDHRFLIRELEENLACICGGETLPEFLDNLPGIVSRLSVDRGQLLEMHRRAGKLIDGDGVRRIVRVIQDLYQAVDSKGRKMVLGT